MTREIQSIALERAAQNVYFHGHPDRAPSPISDASYNQSMRQMGSLVGQGIRPRGTFTVDANGSGTDHDHIGTIDDRGLHGGFSLAALMAEKRGELEAQGVSSPVPAAAVGATLQPRVDHPSQARAETNGAVNEAPLYSTSEARQLAKELRHNKDAVEFVEAYLDGHGGKSKKDNKIGIGERGQFGRLLSNVGNAELEQVIDKLSTIKINASKPDGYTPASQIIADVTPREPRSL